jgi:hypothetical protein
MRRAGKTSETLIDSGGDASLAGSLAVSVFRHGSTGLLPGNDRKRTSAFPHGQRLEGEKNVVTVHFDKHESKIERRSSAVDANFHRTVCKAIRPLKNGR